MHDEKLSVYSVLLAGGTGTRLWPISRELYPKQLVRFIGDVSLVQNTINRISPILNKDKIRIVCGKKHYHEIARQMEEINLSAAGKIFQEPCGRNTAPAILMALLLILKEETDAIISVFPADHVIQNEAGFQQDLIKAVDLADKGYIITFGIKPDYPETGYGYVEGGNKIENKALTLKRFVEKPDLPTAQKYLEAGTFFWNSGMFAFKASVMLAEFAAWQPELLEKMQAFLGQEKLVAEKGYENLPDISIDYAIMEHTRKGAILPSDFGWSDIGSWKSLYDFLPKDKNKNVLDGDIIAKNTNNCFIKGYKRLIATNKVSNLAVVETPDSIFISDLAGSRDVQAIVADLKKQGRKECHHHPTIQYRWGFFCLLEERTDSRVSRLKIYKGLVCDGIIFQGSKLHIVLTHGLVEIFADKKVILKVGDSITISRKDKMEIKNLANSSAYMIVVDLDLKKMETVS